MNTRVVILMALLAGIPAAAWADGSPAKVQPSGVSGIVGLKPGCPGPQKKDEKDEDCRKPLADKSVQLIDATDKVVASTTSDASGKYTLHAKPGKYSLKVVIDALYPRCPMVEVQVHKHALTDANILCDSGMR